MRSAFLALFALSLVDCSDPVPDGQLAALPGENPAIPVGEYHRAGQPCVICHAPGGPASDSPFAIAGTVFQQPQNAIGLANATVAMTDTSGSTFTVQTNCVGNFFVPRPGTGDGGATWDPAFPIFVRIWDTSGRSLTMQGQIGRERSCANCHYDAPAGSLEVFSSVGHLHLYAATDTPPAIGACPVSPVLQ
jgi:hypothetical protein